MSMPSAKLITDPRVYARAPDALLVDVAARVASHPPASQQAKLIELCKRIAHLLRAGEEQIIRAALATPGSRAAGALLFDALERSLAPPPALTGVQTRLFAIPVLLVTGGKAGAVLPGVVPDIGALARVFEQTGALGHARNFGFSNALTSLDSLEAISWSQLYRTAHGEAVAGIGELDLPPADICCDSRDETVHLRFLAGAMVTPADAPGFVETGADIGRWGMAFTRALGSQLSAEGVSLLAIPRPPANFLRAARNGLYMAKELGLQLFLSNALRHARTRSGDPDVKIASRADASVRVRLTSVFDDLFDRTYVWPLAPLDDLTQVSESIFTLLADCRLDRVEVLGTVQGAEEKN